MNKVLLLSTFLLITFLSCQKDNTASSFNYESDTPVWLQAKINSISTDISYRHAEVYRYEWNEELVYHIKAPLSSCFLCELYFHDGSKVELSVDEFSNFMENKKNSVLIWEWNDE